MASPLGDDGGRASYNIHIVTPLHTREGEKYQFPKANLFPPIDSQKSGELQPLS